MSMADQAAENLVRVERMVRSGIADVRNSKTKNHRKTAVAALRRNLADLTENA